MRDGDATLALGSKGEGKTSQVLHLINKQLVKNEDRKFLFYHPSGKMPDCPSGLTFPDMSDPNYEVVNFREMEDGKFVFQNDEDVLAFFDREEACNSTLFLDDIYVFCSQVLTKTENQAKLFKGILSQSRHRGQDWIIGTQSLSQMPRNFTMTMFKGVYLFRNNEDWDTVKRDLPMVDRDLYNYAKSMERFDYLAIDFLPT